MKYVFSLFIMFFAVHISVYSQSIINDIKNGALLVRIQTNQHLIDHYVKDKLLDKTNTFTYHSNNDSIRIIHILPQKKSDAIKTKQSLLCPLTLLILTNTGPRREVTAMGILHKGGLAHPARRRIRRGLADRRAHRWTRVVPHGWRPLLWRHTVRWRLRTPV